MLRAGGGLVRRTSLAGPAAEEPTRVNVRRALVLLASLYGSSSVVLEEAEEGDLLEERRRRLSA